MNLTTEESADWFIITLLLGALLCGFLGGAAGALGAAWVRRVMERAQD